MLSIIYNVNIINNFAEKESEESESANGMQLKNHKMELPRA